jgi:ferrochelatase
VADALLVVSFGGPEGQDDVIPFLRNVVRGRNVSPERLEQVATHYRRFGGVSPLNSQIRALITAVRDELANSHIDLPVYWGNRNWHPFLADTIEQMAFDGRQQAIAFITSPYASGSGRGRYLEDIAGARAKVGGRAPVIEELPVFYNHPGFVGPNTDNLRVALEGAGHDAPVAFTAHSVPATTADSAEYVAQLNETARLVAEGAGASAWRLVYQSRSGPPTQSWLEPDIGEHLRALAREGARRVVVAPIGFISDHMEVVYDLDVEARGIAEQLGLSFFRTRTVGTAPAFVAMIRQLVEGRLVTPDRSNLAAPDHS